MSSASTQAPASLPDPPATDELVVGLVGAVGTDIEAVATSVRVALDLFGYQTEDLHLSDHLTQLGSQLDVELVEEPYDERVWSYMTAGNELRDNWARNDAFALLALSSIASSRKSRSGSFDVPTPRQAYVIRSLKRPEEARLLREVYGSRFVLLAAYSPEGARRTRLEQTIKKSRLKPHSKKPKHSADELMRRDEAEANVPHGQAVGKLFHQADFFVDATDTQQRLDREISRFLELLFGHPNRTPSRDEAAMFQAHAASRRSAELGRQVGAVLTARDGSVVAVGVNEVPKAGGGQYWEGDPGDQREFHLGNDQSDLYKRRIADQIVDTLCHAKPELLREDADLQRVVELIGLTPVDDLIEYVRAVHAEMAAITDAAVRGVPTSGCTLYVTTFPCHHCARHVVAAGIMRVVYVSPYAKSLAEELHSDSIVVTSHLKDGEDPGPRVRFEPFVGAGASRYLDWFDFRRRKDSRTGEVAEFDPASAQPVLPDLDPPELRADKLPYLIRERRAQDLLFAVQEDRSPSLTPTTTEVHPPQGGAQLAD